MQIIMRVFSFKNHIKAVITTLSNIYAFIFFLFQQFIFYIYKILYYVDIYRTTYFIELIIEAIFKSIH